jgi:hypothetical protein
MTEFTLLESTVGALVDFVLAMSGHAMSSTEARKVYAVQCK